MGQALRRASGRIQASSSSIDRTPSTSSKSKNVIDQRPTAVGSTDGLSISKTGDPGSLGSAGTPEINAENVLEERDPKYDAMLSQMVGRISSKPGGKLEMGEAFVVEKYNKPMPKLRNTKPDSGGYGERPVPPGSLNVAQLRHIILLHQGKADDHEGPMNVQQIAEKFRVDVKQVEGILQFLTLPPEDSSKQKDNI
ncbi:hypothetical protein I3843_02G070900 [Carya illinoinensis]|uniref:Uncharacterized protein n=1 Tax=Carya illinoinensis TaxID=32201 RepID=A0A922FTJ1_CARIL|nr:hypothetical protein I3842_02G082800 [Carya illinoinensis]KAG7991359.1 hypothetical protein I3843_02G070900 [Carya illinoinensis]